MAIPAIPAQGAPWLSYAQGLDDEIRTGRLSDTALRAAFEPHLSRRLLPPKHLTFPRLAAVRPTIFGPEGTLFTSRVAATQVTYVGAVDGTGVIAYGGSVGWRSGTDGAGATGFRGSQQPSGSSGPSWYAEFVTDAPGLGLHCTVGAGATVDIEVDGELISSNPIFMTSAGNTTYWDIVYGTRRLRHYRIWAPEAFALRSVTVNAIDTIYRPPNAYGSTRVAWQGDSYAQSTGNPSGSSGSPWTIPLLTSKLLGWTPVVDSDGGSGYLVNSGGGSTLSFPNRSANITGLTPAPDVIVVAGGINDGTTGLQTAATSLLTTYRAAFPRIPIFVLGPWAPSSTSETSQAAKYTAISAAATAAGCTFIDPRGWITGTGRVGATTGSGNADTFISSDATHPTLEGKKYLASRVAQAITAALSV